MFGYVCEAIASYVEYAAVGLEWDCAVLYWCEWYVAEECSDYD